MLFLNMLNIASLSCLLQPLPVPCALLAPGPVAALSPHAHLVPLEPPALLARLTSFSVMPLISAPQAHGHLLSEGSFRHRPSASASLDLEEVGDEDYCRNHLTQPVNNRGPSQHTYSQSRSVTATNVYACYAQLDLLVVGSKCVTEVGGLDHYSPLQWPIVAESVCFDLPSFQTECVKCTLSVLHPVLSMVSTCSSVLLARCVLLQMPWAPSAQSVLLAPTRQAPTGMAA
jgi:hypothetical protein